MTPATTNSFNAKDTLTVTSSAGEQSYEYFKIAGVGENSSWDRVLFLNLTFWSSSDEEWIMMGIKGVPQTIDNMKRALAAAGNTNFTKVVFPKAGHGLFESERGANSEIPMAKRLAPHLFQTLTEWLQRHGLD